MNGWGVGCAEHDSGVEEGAGDTRGDCDQLALPGEDLDLSRASEFWEVYRASGADSGGSWFVCRDGWELGQQFAGVNEKGIENPFGSRAMMVRLTRQRNGRATRFGPRIIEGRLGEVAGLAFADRRQGRPCPGEPPGCGGEFVESVSVSQREFGNGGAPKRLEMRPTSESLAHIVRDRAHVGSRGHTGAKFDTIGLHGEDLEFLDLDLHRFED